MALEGYTWRMLQSPGMFDLRGSGQYALAIESAIADGLIGMADVLEHCADLRSTCGFPDDSPVLDQAESDAVSSYLAVPAEDATVLGGGRVCRLNWGRDEYQASASSAFEGEAARQMNGLLSHTVGNLIAVPCDVAAFEAECCGNECRDSWSRIDFQLSVVYRWLMGKPEPEGSGEIIRSYLGYEDAMSSDRVARDQIPAGALVRWICGSRPLGSPVDRQWRWDAFVSRNCLHEYMGPADFVLFGPPVPYDDDPARRLVQVNARIVARWNRMRNVATGRGLAHPGVARVFGE